jgi:predicted nucleic acid-binding protein
LAVYLDSSSIVKFVVHEPESRALQRFSQRRPLRVSSALARVEVLRAAARKDARFVRRAERVLARIRLLRMDDAILESASQLNPGVLRSLDAIHLASAAALGTDLECVVTYDKRMLDAAVLLGLPVRCPGSPWDRQVRRSATRRRGP